MKEMKIILSEKRRNLVDDLLKEYNMSPRIFVTEATDSSTREREVQWSFYIQNEFTNSFIERLKNVGVGTTYGVVSMVPVDFFISSDTDTSDGETSLGINLEEILFSLKDSSIDKMYVILAILSGVLAGYGIANESAVILIGSMIVAPLLGPIALTSVGLLTPRRGILSKGIKTEVAGLLITVGTGVLVGFSIMAVNYTFDPSKNIFGNIDTTSLVLDACSNYQISSRLQLNMATIVLAVFSGLAAGVIISKGMSVNIVGVAIAASICPPATNIGLNISLYLVDLVRPNLLLNTTVNDFFKPVLLSSAFLILNILLINITITIVFWLMGIASKSGITSRRKFSVIRQNILWLAMLLIVAILLIYTFNTAGFSGRPYCKV